MSKAVTERYEKYEIDKMLHCFVDDVGLVIYRQYRQYQTELCYKLLFSAVMLRLSIILIASLGCASAIQCENGGEWVADSCTMNAQCEPYRTSDPVACIAGKCCTLPCSNNGTYLQHKCAFSTDCLPYTYEPVACLNCNCCTVGFLFLLYT